MSWRPWGLSLLLSASALALTAGIAPRVAVPPLAAGIVGFACVGAEVVAAAWHAPVLRGRARLLALLFVALLGSTAAARGAPPLLLAILVTVGLLGAGTLVGAAVGGAIQHPGYLSVVALVSSMVDVFSVLHPRGPTAQLVQIEAAVNILVLPWPMLGTSDILPVLGVGDVAFAGIYMAATRTHGLSLTRSAVGLALGLASTLATLLAFRVAIPALPFMGAGVLLLQPAARRLPPEDQKTAAIGIGVLAALFTAAFLLR